MKAFTLLITSVMAASLWSQTPSSGTILLAMGMNVKQVVQYEWKQRVTVVRKGKPTEPIVDQVRFDSSGKMQRTTLSAPPEQTGGIRGRIAAGVKENVKDIMELAGQYNKPQQMVEAVKKARMSPASGSTLLRLEANDLLQPADSMVMLVNSTSHLAKHVDIKTLYDGGPMTIAQDYGPVPAGPNMMKSMVVSVPQKDLVIKVESFDFMRQNAAMSRSLRPRQ